MTAKPSYEDLEKKVQALERKVSAGQWEQKAKAERTDLFLNLIESSVEGLLIQSRLKPLFVNPACAAFFGYDTHEILAMDSILALFYRDDHPKLMEQTYARLNQEKGPVSDVYRGLRKDGAQVWLAGRTMTADWDGERAVQMNISNHSGDAEAAAPAGGEESAATPESLPVGFFRITPGQKGEILFANQRLLRTFGAGAEAELKRLRLADLFDDPAEAKTLVERLNAEKTVYGKEILLKKCDGTPFWAILNAALRHDAESGRPACYECTVEDITVQKKREETLRINEAGFRSLVENALQGILIHKDLKPVFVNQAYADIYGYSRREILEMETVLPLFAVSEHDRIKEYHAARQKGENAPVQYDYQGVHRSGSLIWLENWVMEVTWGGEPAIQKTIFDISYRKRSEKALRKAKADVENANQELLKVNEKLEDAIRKANEMAAVAERATAAKSEFMTSVSHEFRGPLNSIIGMVDLLGATVLDDEQEECLKAIQIGADTLLRVVNDILDFSKIKTGEMDLEYIDFDLKTAVESVAETAAEKAREKQLEFFCEIEPNVPSSLKGDPWRLRQVLSNFLNNAIKFTDMGQVTLKVVLEDEKDEDQVTVCFIIIDTGVGISRKRQERLFESFGATEDAEEARESGLGIGLAISRELVEMMGGAIGFESEKGKGSTFWFTLPFSMSASRGGEEQPVLFTDLQDKKVLVVESNDANRDVVCAYLKPWKCQYESCATPEEALFLLNKAVSDAAPFDVVLIDHIKPVIDGERLGKTIKEEDALKDTVMVMLPSQAERGDAARVYDIGFAAYLVKPLKSSLLFDCLVTVLSDPRYMNVQENKPMLITRHTLAESRKRVAEESPVDDLI